MKRIACALILVSAARAGAGTIPVHVITWNLHGLFAPIAPRTPTRMKTVGDEVFKKDPDVVMFQEVWLRRYANILKRKFKRYQAVEYHSIAPVRTGGLLVFIKSGWTVEHSEFVEYSSIAPAWHVGELDGLSGKGFLAIDVTTPDGARLTLIDTHLQSQYDKPDEPDKPSAKHNWREVREAELQQLDQYGKSRNRTIILAGDFNTMPDEPMMKNFKMSWGELTEQARIDCNYCGTHWDKKTNQLTNEWIDYIFVLPAAQATATVALWKNTSIDNPYSDHNGLDAQLTVTVP